VNHPLIALGSMVAWALSLGYCPAAETLKERFLREAPEGWRALRTAAEKVAGEGRFLNVVKETGEAVIELQFKFKRNGDWLLWEQANLKSPKRSTAPKSSVVTGINSSYAFELRLPADNGPCALTRVGSDDQTMQLTRELARTVSFISYLQCPWSIGGEFQLDETINHPTFQMTSIEEVSSAGRQLVRLQFQAAVDVAQHKRPPLKLRSGWILLDPTISWAMRECDIVLEPNRLHLLVEYATAADQNRLLKVTATRYENHKADHDVVFDFKSLERREVPESEFSLSAYGLLEPELVNNKQKPTPWWLWGALAGGALLVLGAVFGWLRQRAKR
jgi:hypothetical protein